MTALKEALTGAIGTWKFDDSGDVESTAEIEKTALTNTEYMFNMIRAHGSMTGVDARDELEARGIKWAKDSSAVLGQLARRGLMSSAKGHTSAGYATNRYACLYPEYHRSVRSTKKRKAKLTAPQALTPTASKREAMFKMDFTTPAAEIVEHLTLRQARAVYDELAAVFGKD